ncbi:hypothetical protein [Falsiruegeria mediterranea]|jgi:hypothetical protein|uniref:C-type lysozyme inhibitor domain-containing protein n=1 Tax=Falsiruegeria mediterranea M17 TaxID=1200281 RepID=A0A2R8C2M9_9RHOB|nr:hypothetical protein [Falsiruegeria mediterranea]SPJ26679.1 hypothetical protein TRM7615_00147 [Falsiruegeria mediterranea M17]
MRLFSTITFVGALTLSGAAFACPWASGDYAFSEHGVYGDFTVNADCTEMVWSRLSDGAETTALERTKHGWAGELEKADVELLDNGKNLRITGTGGAMRQARAERKN